MNGPTREQVCAYLQGTGWEIDTIGSAATLWVRRGHSIRMVHGPLDQGVDEVLARIAMAEDRHPADVRDDVLGGITPRDAQADTDAISSLCLRGAGIVRRQLEDASDNGWPGVWDWRGAEAMGEQATALAEALMKTAALIEAAPRADPAYPWHPLWTVAAKAAEAIVRAEPRELGDAEDLKRHQEALILATIEQGVKPITNVNQLCAAPEDRLPDAEFLAFLNAVRRSSGPERAGSAQ